MISEETIEEYIKSLRPLPIAHLEWMAANVDKERYPERHKAIIDAISEKKLQPQGEDNEAHKTFSMRLEFHGSAREYFRIWIVNLCLTLLTFGIFSAWAKVRKKRYLYSHTTLAGTPFQFLGQPIPILKGRVIAAIGFLAYYTASHLITSLLPYILAAGLVVSPWVIVRSAAFNARYSAFRNMTFHFDGGYLDVVKVFYAWGIILAVVIGMMSIWPEKPFMLGIPFAVIGFSYPWWIKRLKKFIVEHTSYGGKKGAFSATGGQFFRIYFVSGLILLALLIPSGILAGILFGSTKKWGIYTHLMAVPMYAGYVLAFAYNRARSGNLVWNHTQLGPLRFESTMRCRDLLKLYVTNALGIAVSLGLLIPWAVMRTLRYRAENLRGLQEGELSEFQGGERSAVTAIGAETVDFFDVDLSL
ncbi:MAG: YjgN family protein [Thermodesulfobacteriota bacterium]